MEFLRQLSLKNAKLIEPFTKFYEQAPHSSFSESSDDEFMPTQSTVSTSTSQTLSQTSMHVDDISAESSFENSNALSQRPFVLQPSTANVPANIIIPDGCELKSFSILVPSVKEGMDKMKKEKREKEKAEDERRQQLLAKLELIDLPEEQPHHCKICRLGVECNTNLIPCGHICCSTCWSNHLDAHKKKCEADVDLSPEERIKRINEPGCLFCRTKVTNTFPLYFS